MALNSNTLMRTAALTTCLALVLSCDTGPVEIEQASFVLSVPPVNAAKKKSAGSAYKAHLKKLDKKLPEGMTVVVQKPFVVIGDEEPMMVKLRAKKTVKWAVDLLKKDFFTKDPKRIIDIWLFKDGESYMYHSKKLFGHVPDTPYGYYMGKDHALVMNIATGGGTLVHEIVHPFIESNFPDCPGWFNEGLGSLYEQSTERDGHIVGLTNWRLEGLQEAIAEDSVPTFKWLTSRTEDQFYDEDPGTNYAQSRYLLYYLQEEGLLVDYYHDFLENREEDPTGYATLEKTLGVKDMEKFQDEWEAWVLELTFP